jgi:hypothetical protein
MKESITLTSSQVSGYRRIWYTLQDSSAWLIFFSIWALYVVVSFLQQRLVFTEEVVYNTFSEQLAYDRIEELLQARKDWEWLSYTLTPIFIFLQVFYTTICLNIVTLWRSTLIRLFYCHFLRLWASTDVVRAHGFD